MACLVLMLGSLGGRSEAANLEDEVRSTFERYVAAQNAHDEKEVSDLLIDAFENISTGMHLVLAGGSSHSDEYMNRLRQHESPQVRVLPWVAGEDLDELLTNAAIFVLPSDLEGLSLALLDAMAAGVCVLASDIPENQEVVGGIGFTFRHGNRSDLSRVLDLLIRNADLRRESAAKCEQHVRQHYLWPDIASSIEKAYYKVLDRSHPAEAVATAVERRSSVA